jgi:peptidoglycan/xylan/chitin deacetylase (PgdA/CDA1 family)
MDHDLYRYWPIIERPPLHWPNGSHVASCVFVYFEHWEMDPPPTAVRDMRFSDLSGYYFPDYRTYSWRQYGNRVGIFRILDLLDRFGIKATVAANSSACERYPYLVEQFAARGYEFAAHGTHATRMLTGKMDEAEERAFISESLETIVRTTGQRPIGWIGQDFGESTRTPRLLAEMGFSYVADWPNDDQPYPMAGDPPLISIPNQAEWDDVQLLWHRRLPMPRYSQVVLEAFWRLHQEGQTNGRFFGLHIHPWLLGMPHRISQLERIVETMAPVSNNWWATAGEVCKHVQTLETWR